jgi:hypothetical protein
MCLRPWLTAHGMCLRLLADGTWNVPATIGGFDTETPRAWFSIDERKLIEIENQSASVFQPVFLNVAFQSVSLACLWGSA